MENPEIRPNVKTKIGFALGHVMNDMCASMWFTYLLLYFHKVLHFDNLYAGILLLIGQLADGFSTVFVGVFSDSGDDNWFCNKLGTRKAWHFVGCLCVIGSFPFIFSTCFGCTGAHESAQLVYYAAFVIIFQFGWAATQISHLAAIPDLANSQNERTGLTAIRYAMTVLSNILVYAVAWGLFQGNDDDMIDENDKGIFRDLMLVCVSVGSFASICYQVYVKFPSYGNDVRIPSTSSTSTPQADNVQVIKSIFGWFKEYQLYQIALVYMSTRLFVNLTQAYIPLYLQVTLQLQAKYVATVPLTIFLSGFFTSASMKIINEKLGRKITFILGGIFGISGCLWVQYGCDPLDDNIKIYVYFVAILIGIGGSTMLVTSLSLTAEFIGCDTASSAFIYGVMSLTDKVSNGVAVVVIQHFIPSTNDDCTDCAKYFRDVILYACGGSALVGIMASISLYNVTVGQRRNQPRQTQENVMINEQPDERSPLLA